MSHTPGPWEVNTYVQHEGYSISAKGYGCIAERWYPWKQEEPFSSQIKGNAILISAAPDLLAVVKELEESVAYWSEYDVPVGLADRIRAAIAKAEGRR